MTAFTLVQITDTHLLADPTAQLRGCNPWQTLQDCLRQVATHQPNGVLLTGDLADQGQPAAYDALVAAVSTLGCPVYWLPGNHDDVTQMQVQLQIHSGFAFTPLNPPLQRGETPSPLLSRSVPRGRREGWGGVFKVIGTRSEWYGLQAVDLGAWRLLLLNSVLLQAKWGEGYLAADQLHWLREELAKWRDRPTLVALHHHPVPTGIDWVDLMPVQNSADFLAILADFAQVRVVVFGHIHHELEQEQLLTPGAVPISFYGCPSTCLQVTPPQPVPDADLPGFRLLYLNEDGSHQTQIQRVQTQVVVHD
ncbi:MAG: metallophosphoesterase [Leptolyngbyaceae cyanobacterium]